MRSAASACQLRLLLFLAASAACGAAPSVGVLVAARVLQAASAALLTPASLALVLGAFPADRRAVVVSLWGATEAQVPDAGPVALLARANRWFGALLSGRHDSIMALAKVEGQACRDITRTIYLAFLAPDIVERFVRGEQPIGLGVRRLMAMSPLPMAWGEQRRALGLT
jgi:hypothetical protein